MSPVRTSPASAPSRATRFIAFPLIRIVLGSVAVAAPVAVTLWLAHAALDKSMRLMWPQFLAATLGMAGYGFYVHRVEKRAVSELSREFAWRDLAQGSVGAAALLAVTMGILFLAQSYRVAGVNNWTVLVVPVAELILVAVFEELIFRGIVFRVVEQSLGTWIALGLTSLIFALSHLPNGGLTLLAVAVTVAAGVMLGAAFMATGRLWLAMGLHFGWNYMLGSVFSIAVSGRQDKGFVQGVLVGPEWLTGGAYGIEGSVVGLAAVSLASVLLIRSARQRGRIVLPYWKRRSETSTDVRTVAATQLL